MATIQDLSAALVKADAAGDSAGATTLANAIKSMQAAGPQPGTPEYAASIQAKVNLGQPTPQPATPPPEWHPTDNMAAPLRAFSTHAVESIPIAGAALQRQRLANQTPYQAAVEQSADQQAPAAAVAGNVFGTVAPFVAGGEIPAVAKVLGMEAGAPLLARTLAAAGSNAVISGADTLAGGGNLGDAAKSAALGGTIGAVLPGASDLVGKGLSVVGQKGGQIIDALTNPANAAQKVVSGAAAQDVRAGQFMTPHDEANAILNGQPVVNADRFGPKIRDLARTAKNADATAGGALDDLTQQRFLTQSDRAKEFVTRISGGNVDDLATQAALQNAAKTSNKAAYDAAYAAPGAHAVWSPQIRQLFQSPDFVSAVQGAERTAANDAAVNGTKAVKSPFTFTPDGQGGSQVGLKTNPDGSRALPSLQFWDAVQRNLRGQADQAATKGNKVLSGQYKDMRTQLLQQLDGQVPAFQTARQGAAKAFGAEDALDAGRQFVMQRMAIPEAQAAHAQFSPAEQKLFGVGFASSLIDKINAASDRVNVINSVFGSPASRAQVELALGKPAAAQLEHFTRVEDIMQMTKQAVQGNSSTAKQLIAAGVIGGGLGGALGGWDPRNIALGSTLLVAGRAGARALGQSVDQKVMQNVAQILASGDKNAINRTILNATISPQHSLAIKAIEKGLQETAQAGTVALSGGSAPTTAPTP